MFISFFKDMDSDFPTNPKQRLLRPSTCSQFLRRPPSARALEDVLLLPEDAVLSSERRASDGESSGSWTERERKQEMKQMVVFNELKQKRYQMNPQLAETRRAVNDQTWSLEIQLAAVLFSPLFKGKVDLVFTAPWSCQEGEWLQI